MPSPGPGTAEKSMEEAGQKTVSDKTDKRVALSKKPEDDSDCKKTQAQRLLEFEMWTDGQTLKQLEYTQRRSEKKMKRQQRKMNTRSRRWKKLYLPAILGMLGGTVLTLCGTLRSMGGDTILWEIKGALIIIGPIVLGFGLVALMMAAACTFEHDQQVVEHPRDPLSEFLLHGTEFKNNFNSVQPSLALRSISVDTEDLPVPDDLDPNKNYMVTKSPWSGTPGNISRNESTGSTFFQNPNTSYSSTASWVRSVSASHDDRLTLTRQNSDSNIVVGRAGHNPAKRRSLHVEYGDCRDPEGSNFDLHVVCTRSLTSSGYQSASDSTSGPVEYQFSSDNNTGVDVVFSSTSLRQAPCRTPSDTASKSPTRKSAVVSKYSDGTGRRLPQKGSVNSGIRRSYPGQRRSKSRDYLLTKSASPRNQTNVRSSCSSAGSLAQDKRKSVSVDNRIMVKPGRSVSVSSNVDKSGLTAAGEALVCDKDSPCANQVESVSNRPVKHPVVLEPIMYRAGTVRCTEV